METMNNKLIYPKDSKHISKTISKLEEEIAWLKGDMATKKKNMGRKIMLKIKEKELYNLKYMILLSIAEQLPATADKGRNREQMANGDKLMLKLSSQSSMN
jgi:hypothetical protein